MGLLYLFRHGETDLIEGRYCGSGNPPLNKCGREQAARIAEFLRSKPISAIYASPMLRAVQTAEPSARVLATEITTVAALREVDFGEWEGLTFAQARARDPEIWRRREADPLAVAAPGGEPYCDLVARSTPAFDELRARHRNEDIAVFAHKSVNRFFIARLLLMPLPHFRRIGQEPAAVTIIKSRGDSVTVLTINERCHLGLSGGDLCRVLSGAPGATGISIPSGES